MSAILRNFDQGANERFDVIIVGGGIYGSMLMLEAVRAGLKPLLLEKADFGGGTSFNNLRIVHGGLRYLQTMNFPRIRESVTERRWFLRTFPDLIRPMPCLMPLYGGLTKNRFVMATALRINDWLTRHRNDGLDSAQHISDCQLLSASATIERFPQARSEGLKAGALWFDAVMPDCQRVLFEILHWAVAGGGTALNYADVSAVITAGKTVTGVSVTDCISKQRHEFLADVVINATGPSCRAFASQNDIDRVELFRPSHAWNLLLDRPALANGAVAIEAPGTGSRVFFAHSLGGKLLVGTGHAEISKDEAGQIRQSQIEAMLVELNKAIPTLNVKADEVIRIFAGQLPVHKTGTTELSDKPIILDHYEHGGRRGLYTVSGVKYTTARSTAEAVIAKILHAQRGKLSLSGPGLPSQRPQPAKYKLHPKDCIQKKERVRRMQELIASESALTIADVLLRRSNLASDPAAAMIVANDCCEAFCWTPDICGSQIGQFEHELANQG